jgi:hypothetical protein
MSWYQFVLFLHILVAIMAFGPTFIFGIIAATGAKEPAHSNFAVRLSHILATRWVTPLAVVMPGLGALLIFLGKWDLWESEWLLISIAIYIQAFFFALLFMDRWEARLIELTAEPAAGGPGAVSGGQGPPPEVASLVKRLRIGGALLGLDVLAMLLLMVWKPGGAFVGG